MNFEVQKNALNQDSTAIVLQFQFWSAQFEIPSTWQLYYSEIPNRRACSPIIFQIFFHPASRFSACSLNRSKKYFLHAYLFRPASVAILPNWLFLTILMVISSISTCLLDFRKNFHPAHLFRPTRFYFFQKMSVWSAGLFGTS